MVSRSPKNINRVYKQVHKPLILLHLSENDYARQRVAFTGTGVQTNAEAIRFSFTGAVGTLSHLGLFDAAAGGNPLSWGTLSAATAVTGSGTVTVNPGSLTMTGE